MNVLSAKLDQQSDRSIHLEAQLATQSLQFKGLSTQLNKTKDDVAEIQNQCKFFIKESSDSNHIENNFF